MPRKAKIFVASSSDTKSVRRRRRRQTGEADGQNTDFDLTWRKRVIKDVVTCALRELSGDDMRDWRRKLSRMIV